MSRTEKDKMLAGELYNCNDPELRTARLRAREHAISEQEWLQHGIHIN